MSKLYGAIMILSDRRPPVSANYRLIPEGDQRRRLRWAFFGVIALDSHGLALWLSVYVDGASLEYRIDRAGCHDRRVKWAASFLYLVPVTLAYAILKHRVLGIRVAMRMGIRHLLATNVLRVLFILPFAALIYDLVSQRDKSIGALLFQTSAQWKLLLAIAVAASSRYRRQLSTTIDKRFFRDAYNQEGILTALRSRSSNSIRWRKSPRCSASRSATRFTQLDHGPVPANAPE